MGQGNIEQYLIKNNTFINQLTINFKFLILPAANTQLKK